jgi:hypothetical protein
MGGVQPLFEKICAELDLRSAHIPRTYSVLECALKNSIQPSLHRRALEPTETHQLFAFGFQHGHRQFLKHAGADATCWEPVSKFTF